MNFLKLAIILFSLGVGIPTGAAQSSRASIPGENQPWPLDPITWDGAPLQPLRSVLESSTVLGPGTLGMDPVRNSWGIPYANFESDLPWVLLDNQQTDFSLSPAERMGAQGQVITELGRRQALRTRWLQREGRGNWNLDFVAKRSRAERTYLDGGNTAYDNSDDREASYRPRKDSLGFKGRYQSPSFETLASIDLGQRDTYAGPRFLGLQRNRFIEWDGTLNYESWRPTAFGFFSDSEFSSRNVSLASVKRRGVRLGLRTDFRIDASHFLAATISNESLRREDSVARVAKFSRQLGELNLGGKYVGSVLEFQWSGVGRVLQDSGLTDQERRWLWDLGANLSSSRLKNLGASIRGYRQSRAPTPSSVFGDGAVVDPNPELEPEVNLGAALGPWWVAGPLSGSVEYFGEESRNVPIAVGASALRAKIFSLGGVWSRGWLVKAKAEFFEHWRVESSATFQEVLNAGSVRNERGRLIPGKPRQLLFSALVWEPSRWTLRAEHEYRAAETLNLVGTLRRPTRHRFNLSVGYGTENYRLVLSGRNLFASVVRLGFEGLAGDQVLDPLIEEREILFTWEQRI